jgi:hypothetical protein
MAQIVIFIQKILLSFKQVLPIRDPESSLLISPVSGFRMTMDGFLTGKRVNVRIQND